MKKMLTLFKRDEKTHLVINEVAPNCQWVVFGEGVPTRKYDGTACRIDHGAFWKRYDCKAGRTPPPSFTPCEKERDPVTGHWPGWVLVTKDDKWHLEAFDAGYNYLDGTYELCGPKVQGNPEGFDEHILLRHGRTILDYNPRTYDELRHELWNRAIEGIVWHHPDGRMCKIKRRDFGFKWPVLRKETEDE
jgi:hypothetical protein